MPDGKILEASMKLDDIGCDVEDSDFEEAAKGAAVSKLLQNDVIVDDDCEKMKIHDILVNGDDVMVMLRKMGISEQSVAPDAVSSPSNFQEKVDDTDADDGVIPIDESVAWNGPLSDETFELDVLDLCSLLDVVQFAKMLLPQLVQAGQMPGSVPRSLGKIERRMVSLIGDVDVEDLDMSSGQPMEIDINPDFLEHYEAWRKESIDELKQQSSKAKNRVVTATQMPPSDFDQQDGNKKSGPRGLV